MKKTLLTLFVAAGFIGTSLAQDEALIFLDGTTTDLSSGNGVHSVTVNTGGELVVDLEVKNNSGSTKSWDITRYRLNDVTGWEDFMCWGQCFTAGGMSTNPWTNPATYTQTLEDKSVGLLNAHIVPDNANPGTVTYRYYVTTTAGEYVDSVDIEVNYVLGLNDLSNDLSLVVAPNPATDQITVKANGTANATLQIVDVLGNIVLTEEMGSVKTVNVSDFRSGVYFVTVSSEGSKSITKKIIIRH